MDIWFINIFSILLMAFYFVDCFLHCMNFFLFNIAPLLSFCFVPPLSVSNSKKSTSGARIFIRLYFTQYTRLLLYRLCYPKINVSSFKTMGDVRVVRSK